MTQRTRGMAATFRVSRDAMAAIPTTKLDGTPNADRTVLFDALTPAAIALDNMSVYDRIELNVPGGHTSRTGKLLDLAYASEYGADTVEQSSLNLVRLLAGLADPTAFEAFGGSDERYHIQGGNQRLPLAIAADLTAKLGDTALQMNSRLTKIARHRDGTVALSFDLERRGELLRQRRPVLVARDPRPARHQWHPQRLHRWGADAAAGVDSGHQLRGLNVGAQGAHIQTLVTELLGQLEQIYPGVSALYNGKATLSIPHLDPNLRLSYAFWKVGQYQAFAGSERAPQGNIFFAGEHTAVNYQGFMEGAAAEGIRAANEVVAAAMAGTLLAGATASEDDGGCYSVDHAKRVAPIVPIAMVTAGLALSSRRSDEP